MKLFQVRDYIVKIYIKIMKLEEQYQLVYKLLEDIDKENFLEYIGDDYKYDFAVLLFDVVDAAHKEIADEYKIINIFDAKMCDISKHYNMSLMYKRLEEDIDLDKNLYVIKKIVEYTELRKNKLKRILK